MRRETFTSAPERTPALKTDAEYIAIAHALADQRGLQKGWVYRGEFIRTYVKMRRIDDGNADYRARIATEPMPGLEMAWKGLGE